MLQIEVKRTRGSVTQGMVYIHINGETVCSFGDTIEIIQPGQKYYGEKIGGWASTKPDSAFIKGLFYHPLDNVYHYSEIAKNAIQKADM